MLRHISALTACHLEAETCRSISKQIEALCNKLVLNVTYVIQLHGKCPTLNLRSLRFLHRVVVESPGISQLYNACTFRVTGMGWVDTEVMKREILYRLCRTIWSSVANRSNYFIQSHISDTYPPSPITSALTSSVTLKMKAVHSSSKTLNI